MADMKIISNAEVYAPMPLGKADILVGGGKILAVENHIDASWFPNNPEIIDSSKCIVIPGFIDGHQHFIGGGGEGGFQTRTPALQLSVNVRNGVTTAIGLLGTDSLTRSLEDLYAKTQAFNAEGITAFMLTGAYWYPSPTITGSVGKDIAFCQPVIGVKLAISDTRGPHLEAKDLATLASEVQVSALVSGKPGIITLHMGVRRHALDLILEIIDKFEIRPGLFLPTHINRKNPKLLEQVFELVKRGMFADATCVSKDVSLNGDKISASDFAMLAMDNGIFEKVTFSSDAGGSMPIWNEDHSKILGMGIGTPESLLHELKTLALHKHIPLEKALQPLTTTPAKIYGLEGMKGQIKEGFDADILVIDSSDFHIRDVIAKGEVMMRNGRIERKGYFE